MIYRCEFEFSPFGKPERRAVYSERGIHDFIEGFWLNEDFQFTNYPDNKYFIPAHRILYIAKEKEKP